MTATSARRSPIPGCGAFDAGMGPSVVGRSTGRGTSPQRANYGLSQRNRMRLEIVRSQLRKARVHAGVRRRNDILKSPPRHRLRPLGQSATLSNSRRQCRSGCMGLPRRINLCLAAVDLRDIGRDAAIDAVGLAEPGADAASAVGRRRQSAGRPAQSPPPGPRAGASSQGGQARTPRPQS